MGISNNGGVITEALFEGGDEFQRCGVIRDDVFAIRDSASPLKQIKFDASELPAEGSTTVTGITGGVKVSTANHSISIRANEGDGSVEIIASGSTPIILRVGETSTLEVRADGVFAMGPLGPPPYTVATLPSATDLFGPLIYVSDDVGGPTIAFSDGTDWRRVQDRAVISAT